MSVFRTRRLTLLLALSASLGLAACGGGGGDSGTPINQDPNGWNAVTTLKTTDTVVGTGTAIDAGKVAPMAYTVWLYDVRVADTKGTKVETNVGSTPYSFVVGANSVIKGIDQGVVGMKAGGKRTLTIPASLAYGSAGSGTAIPPNAALVFDIEMDPNGWLAVTALKTQDNVVGTGALATAGKKATVTYTGWLYDSHAADTKGTKFNNGSFQFTLGATPLEVIPGFDQGVTGMKVGGKRTLTIPGSLGYGNSGNSSAGIPGGATLVFDVEVTAVN